MTVPRPSRLVLAAALALLPALAGCKSAAEKASDRAMPAVAKLRAAIPAADPKEFVRTAPGSLDKLTALEDEAQAAPRPPAGTPAAAELAAALQWIEAARAENTALEAAFQAALEGVEHEAHEALSNAVLGGPTRPAEDIADALAASPVKPIVLWHGSGDQRGFDADQQNLPFPDRRAVDPSSRFIVGYVARVNGEGVQSASGVLSERKIVFVAFYEMPNKRRLGVFSVQGELARLPTPAPLPGTTLPGEKPPLIESLLPRP
jgi:hypothetical protein